MKAKKITVKHPVTGFIVEFQLEEGDDLRTEMHRLARVGYRSPTATDDWRRTPEGLPICAVHNEVMKVREKQGDKWHSHKVTDPTTGEVHYCRGYAHKSATGFEIRPKTTRRPTPQPPVGFTPPQHPAQRPAQPPPPPVQKSPPPAPPQMHDELPPHIWDDSVVQVLRQSRTLPRKPQMSQQKPKPQPQPKKVDLVDELNRDLFGF